MIGKILQSEFRMATIWLGYAFRKRGNNTKHSYGWSNVTYLFCGYEFRDVRDTFSGFLQRLTYRYRDAKLCELRTLCLFTHNKR